METQFFCKNKNRREIVRNNSALNGIDYLEVTSTDQKTLSVHFLHNLPGQTNPVPPGEPVLAIENIAIEGGVRIKNINVESVSSADNILTVSVDKAGDFSYYTLRLINSSIDSVPPTGYDPQLSSVEFSFKAGCPNEFDCKDETIGGTETLPEPKIDYLAKDYASFRRIMFDRLSLIMPDWKERNPADLQVALVETLAYTADHLSYYQDAVATEAYLGTARKRISHRRHARLLDYPMHDGCNARAWVYFAVEEGGDADTQILPKGTKLLSKGPDDELTIPSSQLNKVLNEQQPQVFETKHDVQLHSSNNEISFYTWIDSECCLPKGATRATLLNEPAITIYPYDVLIFEERYSPTTGLKADANTNNRHAVRLKEVTDNIDVLTNTAVKEIEWFEEDALPFPLCLTALVNNEDGTTEIIETGVALGNIVLVDHGMNLENKHLVPSTAPANGNYRPQLPQGNITIATPYLHESEKSKAASTMLLQDPKHALPEISIVEDDELWTVNRDLLASDRFATEFVAEIEQDGTVQLRFGDDIMGKKPPGGFTPATSYRIGTGRSGNVGRDSITRIVWEQGGFISIRNPLPATGGTNAETMAEAREFAPQAFRTQERAVTEADYAEKTELHSEVQKAAARFHWTGSWYTVFVTIDRKNGLDVDNDFKSEIIRHLEKYRMAAYDLEIRGPRFVPLSLELNVCVKAGYFRSNVKEKLLEVFSCFDLPDGTRGFFHPDNFTFGQPVYLSHIYKVAMAVSGVESVEIKRFQEWAKKPNKEIENGMLQPEELEIIRLDNDPNFPENGKIDFIMFGGL
ncbi:MAG: hypothetical protein R2750_01905 [Bacteroidales bacterium]